MTGIFIIRCTLPALTCYKKALSRPKEKVCSVSTFPTVFTVFADSMTAGYCKSICAKGWRRGLHSQQYKARIFLPLRASHPYIWHVDPATSLAML